MKRKWERNRWSFEELPEHLERRAEQGWLLERIGRYFLIYQKSEPKKMRYEVTFHPKIGDYDPFPSKEHQDYADYCRQAGWEFVSIWGNLPQIEVYVTTRPDPVFIQTDERVKWSVLADWIESRIPSAERETATLGLSGLCLLIVFGGLFSLDGFSGTGTGFLILMGSAAAALVMAIVSSFANLTWFYISLEQIRQAETGERAAPDIRTPLWLLGIQVLCRLSFYSMVVCLLLFGHTLKLNFGRRIWLLFGTLVVTAVICWLVGRVQDWLRRRGAPKWLNFLLKWTIFLILVYVYTKIW